MTVAGEFTEIPVVSLAPLSGTPADRAALADEVRHASHEVGFFVVVDHGVSATQVDSMFDVVKRFFALPLAQKQLIDKRRSPHFRGWEGEGSEYTNGQPDIREQVDLWSDHPPKDGRPEPVYLNLLGPNQWLPEDVLPGYRAHVSAWFETMGELARRLLGVLSLGLGLAESDLDARFGSEQMSLLKLIRYPPTPPGAAGVNPHHDTGFLTVLAPGPTPGLEVQNRSGAWIPVPTVPGGFVINLGEMLQGMTGNYYVATKHRVIAAGERYALGYFHGPSLDMRLDPLDLDPEYATAVAASAYHAGAGFMTRREETSAGVAPMTSPHKPATYGEMLWNYFSRSYPENMRRHYSV